MKLKLKNKLPFFIAEISANHAGDYSLAKKLIRCAKINGADAVKLQTYTPETMTIKSNKNYFKIKDGLWKGYSLWDLYSKAKTPLIWHKKLFEYAKSLKIKIFSTPYDNSAVDFLEKLNCPIYKIASFEMNDLNLIKRVAQTKKPIIISTGTSNLNEIKIAVKTAKKFGAKDITLLYCVSNYPAMIEDFNLNNIKILKEKFKCKVGISDHSNDNLVPIVSVAIGAEVIEKHIALDKQKKGFDIAFSIKGKSIKKLKNDLVKVVKLLGKESFFRNKSEKKAKLLRRSVFTTKTVKKGERFSKQNIKIVRPGIGLSPRYYNKILNKKSPINLDEAEPLRNSLLKKIFFSA